MRYIHRNKNISRPIAHKKYFVNSEKPSTLDVHMTILKNLGIIEKEYNEDREACYFLTDEGEYIMDKLEDIRSKLVESSERLKKNNIDWGEENTITKRQGRQRNLSKFSE